VLSYVSFLLVYDTASLDFGFLIFKKRIFWSQIQASKRPRRNLCSYYSKSPFLQPRK